MTNFKNLIEQAEEENSSMSDFVEYPEGRYLINFVQADEITDFVSKSGKTYDATDIEFHVEGWSNKTLKSRYFTAYGKENSGEDKLHKAALSGTMKLQNILMAMGVKPENFPESIDQFNEVLQGKSATCLLKKREYESNGQKKSTLDLDEDFAGQNWKVVGEEKHIDISSLGSFEEEKIEKKEEAPAPVETKTEEFDEEIPF